MEQYELNINELVKEFAAKKLNGLDYTEIRKELYQRNIEPEMVNQVIRMIDNRVLNSELLKVSRKIKIEYRIVGYILVIIGIAITLTTLLGIVNLKTISIFAVGPILAGLSIIILSKKNFFKERNMVNGRKFFHKTKRNFD